MHEDHNPNAPQAQPFQSPSLHHKKGKRKGTYILGPTLGEGAFAKVKLATQIHTKEKTAIKILDKSRLLQDQNDIQRFKKEINILKKLHHKNIIQLYEVMESNKSLYIVMEYCENGELFDYIVKKRKLNELEACHFFQQIINGVEYIHDNKIIHRDLKPENLLLENNYKNIKITDFGLSTYYDVGSFLQTPCGTPSYAPPEMLKGDEYNGLSSDLWSCGVILYAMLCGTLPYSGSNEDLICQKIMERNYEIPGYLSDMAKDLLRGIMRIDPVERFNIEDIKGHPWFNLTKPKLKPGITVGVNIIPVDDNILDMVEMYGVDRKECKKMLEENHYCTITCLYYLCLRKYIREGGKSVSDLGGDLFERYIKGEMSLVDYRYGGSNNNIKNIPINVKENNTNNIGKGINGSVKSSTINSGKNSSKSIENSLKGVNSNNCNININSKNTNTNTTSASNTNTNTNKVDITNPNNKIINDPKKIDKDQPPSDNPTNITNNKNKLNLIENAKKATTNSISQLTSTPYTINAKSSTSKTKTTNITTVKKQEIQQGNSTITTKNDKNDDNLSVISAIKKPLKMTNDMNMNNDQSLNNSPRLKNNSSTGNISEINKNKLEGNKAKVQKPKILLMKAKARKSPNPEQNKYIMSHLQDKYNIKDINNVKDMGMTIVKKPNNNNINSNSNTNNFGLNNNAINGNNKILISNTKHLHKKNWLNNNCNSSSKTKFEGKKETNNIDDKGNDGDGLISSMEVSCENKKKVNEFIGINSQSSIDKKEPMSSMSSISGMNNNNNEAVNMKCGINNNGKIIQKGNTKSGKENNINSNINNPNSLHNSTYMINNQKIPPTANTNSNTTNKLIKNNKNKSISINTKQLNLSNPSLQLQSPPKKPSKNNTIITTSNNLNVIPTHLNKKTNINVTNSNTNIINLGINTNVNTRTSSNIKPNSKTIQVSNNHNTIANITINLSNTVGNSISPPKKIISKSIRNKEIENKKEQSNTINTNINNNVEDTKQLNSVNSVNIEEMQKNIKDKDKDDDNTYTNNVKDKINENQPINIINNTCIKEIHKNPIISTLSSNISLNNKAEIQKNLEILNKNPEDNSNINKIILKEVNSLSSPLTINEQLHTNQIKSTPFTQDQLNHLLEIDDENLILKTIKPVNVLEYISKRLVAKSFCSSIQLPLSQKLNFLKHQNDQKNDTIKENINENDNEIVKEKDNLQLNTQNNKENKENNEEPHPKNQNIDSNSNFKTLISIFNKKFKPLVTKEKNSKQYNDIDETNKLNELQTKNNYINGGNKYDISNKDHVSYNINSNINTNEVNTPQLNTISIDQKPPLTQSESITTNNYNNNFNNFISCINSKYNNASHNYSKYTKEITLNTVNPISSSQANYNNVLNFMGLEQSPNPIVQSQRKKQFNLDYLTANKQYKNDFDFPINTIKNCPFNSSSQNPLFNPVNINLFPLPHYNKFLDISTNYDPGLDSRGESSVERSISIKSNELRNFSFSPESKFRCGNRMQQLNSSFNGNNLSYIKNNNDIGIISEDEEFKEFMFLNRNKNGIKNNLSNLSNSHAMNFGTKKYKYNLVQHDKKVSINLTMDSNHGDNGMNGGGGVNDKGRSGGWGEAKGAGGGRGKSKGDGDNGGNNNLKK